MRPSTAIKFFTRFGTIYVSVATGSMVSTFLFLGFFVGVQSYVEIKQEGLYG